MGYCGWERCKLIWSSGAVVPLSGPQRGLPWWHDCTDEESELDDASSGGTTKAVGRRKLWSGDESGGVNGDGRNVSAAPVRVALQFGVRQSHLLVPALLLPVSPESPIRARARAHVRALKQSEQMGALGTAPLRQPARSIKVTLRGTGGLNHTASEAVLRSSSSRARWRARRSMYAAAAHRGATTALAGPLLVALRASTLGGMARALGRAAPATAHDELQSSSYFGHGRAIAAVGGVGMGAGTSLPAGADLFSIAHNVA